MFSVSAVLVILAYIWSILTVAKRITRKKLSIKNRTLFFKSKCGYFMEVLLNRPEYIISKQTFFIYRKHNTLCINPVILA